MKRRIIAAPLIVTLLGALQVVAPTEAEAALPTLSPTSRLLGWRGTGFESAAVAGPKSCSPDTCDRFNFRVVVPSTFWNSRLGGVRVWIRWQPPENDFDLYLYQRGELIGSSAGRGTSAEVFIARVKPGSYEALVIPVNVVVPAPPLRPGYEGIVHLEVRPPVPTGTSVHFVPSRITDNCSKDVTRMLLRWIASVPDRSVIVFGRGACYRIDGSLRVEDRWGLSFFGNGATFKAVTEGDQARRHWWFLGGGNLLIRDLVVRGANPYAGLSEEAYRPDREFQHAFAFEGVRGAVLDSVQAYDVFGDFVYIGNDNRPEGGGRWSSGIIVQNSHFERNGRQGVAICAAEDVLIRWNYLGQVRRATFDLEPSVETWGARRVRILENMTGPGKLLWLANAGLGSNVSDIRVIGNVMLAGTGTPVVYVKTPVGNQRGPFLIESNDFLVGGSPMAGLDFRRASGVTVRDNLASFPGIQLMTAVAIQESSAVRIYDNAFVGAAVVLSADAASSDYLEYNNTT